MTASWCRCRGTWCWTWTWCGGCRGGSGRGQRVGSGFKRRGMSRQAGGRSGTVLCCGEHGRPRGDASMDVGGRNGGKRTCRGILYGVCVPFVLPSRLAA